MAYRVERATQADQDLKAILNVFLKRTAISEDSTTSPQVVPNPACWRSRPHSIGPHQATLRPEIAKSRRSVIKGRAIFYFAVNDTTRFLRVLAVFYGG